LKLVDLSPAAIEEVGGGGDLMLGDEGAETEPEDDAAKLEAARGGKKSAAWRHEAELEAGREGTRRKNAGRALPLSIDRAIEGSILYILLPLDLIVDTIDFLCNIWSFILFKILMFDYKSI
jgi:hypothetical protein